MEKVLLFLCVVFIAVHVSAVSLEGVVRDAATGEALIGASVYLKDNRAIGTTTGFDGTFVIPNVQAGKVTVVCSYISYKTIEKEMVVSASGTQKIALNLVSYENELQDVVITASNKTTDVGVRAIERLSSNVMNVVGANSIEISPDLSVANVLGRVSGVTLERNSSGEAEYAVLRGMDKRYNVTLVNGIKISSPNNKQRFVPLNLFPSELLDRLEVSKTRTAEMEGDATGGAVNMVMKDAPHQFSVRANLSVGYNALYLNREFTGFNSDNVIPVSPYEQYGKNYISGMEDFGHQFNRIETYQPLPNVMAGVSVGDRLLNKKLGYMLAVNFQQSVKGANSTFFDEEMLQTESAVRLTSVKVREYSEQQKQYGVHAKIDYQLMPGHKLEWYNFYLSNGTAQVRQSTSTNFKLSYEPENGTLDFSYQTRLRVVNQQIFASMLQGEHALNKRLSLDWTAVVTDARLQRPDQTTIELDNLRQNYVDNIVIDGDGSERRWEHNSDNDYSGLFNVKYKMPLEVGVLKFETGGLYRSKKRENFFVRYTFKPVNTNQSFETFDEITWTVYTPKGSVNPLNYRANEDIGAGYFQTRYEKKKLEMMAGLRAEYTNQGYFMYFPNAGESPTGKQVYVELLPNVHFKYKPNDTQNWRAGYFRSLNRPGFFEVVPYQVKYEEYDEYGNKDLEYATIDNFDVRWEFFPKPTEQLLVGAFYKSIQSPIEYAYFSVNQRQSGYGPRNLGNASNVGVEVDVIKYLRQFGVKANYTYTYSSITTPKVYYGKDDAGNTRTFSANQSRPLVGQAAHVANVSLLFKDVNRGWDAQLAASYTGDKIVIASRFLDSDYWEKGGVQLDASLEKKLKKSGFSIFGKANNLLNTPLIEFIKTHNDYNNNFPMQSTSSNGKTIIRKDYFMQSFLVGVRCKL